jgi:hypothetical protein
VSDQPAQGLLPFRIALTLYAAAVIPLATIAC